MAHAVVLGRVDGSAWLPAAAELLQDLADFQVLPPARAASRDRIDSKQPFGRSRAVAAA
jgi:hypothetical protein